MSKRKTIDLEYLVERANTILANSTLDQSFRQGVCTMIEDALLEAERYQGFGYLNQDQVPKGYAPGIILDKNGVPFRAGRTDSTRRQYAFAK